MHVIVDPSWPATLRRFREARGISLRRLAARVLYSRSYLHDLETGRRQPTTDIAVRLDDALEAEGQLAALVSPAVAAPDADRLAHVADRRGRVDQATIDALVTALAAQRRLEDTIGASAVMAAVRGQVELVAGLVRDARCGLRPALVDQVAQWAQFYAWLCHSTGSYVRADRWYSAALEWSAEADDGELTATVLSFRGYLAEQRGALGSAVGLTRTALRDPDVYVGQRAYDHHQLARLLAQTGDRVAAFDELAVGADLAAAAAEYTQPTPPWHYYRNPATYLLERGRVMLSVGQAEAAIDALTAGLDGVPATADWSGIYLLLLATAYEQAGAVELAWPVLERAQTLAEVTGAGRLAGRVSAAVRKLSVRR